MEHSLIQEKTGQAVQFLNEFGIDCWLTFVRETELNGDPNLSFLSEASLTWPSAFFIHKNGEKHAIVGRYDVPSTEVLNVYDKVEGYVEGIKELFITHVRRTMPKTIAINYSEESEVCDGLTYGMFRKLKSFLEEAGLKDKVALVSSEKIVSALRERKTEAELELIRQAVEVTEEIWEEVAGYIVAGRTEREVADFIHWQMQIRDVSPAWDKNTCPAVFSGIGVAEAHFTPSDKKIKRGELVNIDFGVRYNGYVSDTQRMFYILDEGETEAPAVILEGFNLIVHAIQKAKDTLKVGIQAHAADAVARQIVVEGGYEEFPHGLGHQLGLYFHDGNALLGPKWEKYGDKTLRKLEENMVFTIEPRVKIPEKGNMSIEEMVRVTKTGAEWITTPQKELILIKE